jgi:hypothetical protein
MSMASRCATSADSSSGHGSGSGDALAHHESWPACTSGSPRHLRPPPAGRTRRGPSRRCTCVGGRGWVWLAGWLGLAGLRAARAAGRWRSRPQTRAACGLGRASWECGPRPPARRAAALQIRSLACRTCGLTPSLHTPQSHTVPPAARPATRARPRRPAHPTTAPPAGAAATPGSPAPARSMRLSKVGRGVGACTFAHSACCCAASGACGGEPHQPWPHKGGDRLAEQTGKKAASSALVVPCPAGGEGAEEQARRSGDSCTVTVLRRCVLPARCCALVDGSVPSAIRARERNDERRNARSSQCRGGLRAADCYACSWQQNFHHLFAAPLAALV